MKTESRVIVALDGLEVEQALGLAKRLSGLVWGFKANDLLDGDVAPKILIERLSEHGKVFVDIKAHDIPNTVANRVAKHAKHGAHLVTVHASGGKKMLEAAVKAFNDHKREDALGILAVTVLTSLDRSECLEIYGGRPSEEVNLLAKHAASAGAWGIVCSPQELEIVRAYTNLKFVTPGIRLAETGVQDQVRVDTPANAIRDGAELIVVGRPIVQAADPVQAATIFNQLVAGALGGKEVS